MVPPFTLDLGPLDEETKGMAEKELRETPEVVKQSLEELKQLLKDDPSIHFLDDDEFLMIFLRPCKFYAKSAYELMKRISEFKEKYKNVLDNLVPNDEKVAFTNHNVVNVLKDRDHKGRRVLIVNCGGSWDPSKVTSDQLFRMFYLIHEAAVLEPESQVRGVVVVLDFDSLGTRQVMAFNPAFSMKLLGFIQDAMPLRLKEVHVVKQPFVFNMVWTIFKPFVKTKLKGRMHFHGSKMTSLHKFLEPSHLPKDYGGELPQIDYSGANWFPAIENHLNHIQKMNTCGFVKK